MRNTPALLDDEERVHTLRRLDLLDTAPEEAFDALTRLAADVLQVPIALVSLVDESRQWFKSRVGLDETETPREISFCTHAIQQTELFVVPDATLDERFRNNPLVMEAPHIRAYVGMPLMSVSGHAVGTLCAIDRCPRDFSAREVRILQELASIAQREIQARELTINAHAVAQRALLELKSRKAVYRAIFTGAAVGIALVALDGRWQMVNQRLCEILGRTDAELMGLTFKDITHPEDLEQDSVLRDEILRGDLKLGSRIKRYLKPDGQVVWANVEATAFSDDQGEASGLILVIEDITARRNAELALGELRHQLEQRVSERTRELEQVNRQQHLMLDNDLVGIVKLRGRHALWHNQAFTHIFGGVAGEAIGRSAREVYFDHETFARIGREAYPILASGGTYRTQLPMRHKSGSVLWIDLSGAMLSATTKESIWMLLDITQMKSRHDEVATMAFHDPLTGLANRVRLNERLEQAMANATRQKQQVALCFLDLDGFKAINDQLGHETGDEVLLAVAARLSRSVRTIDTVARLGGDEFVVLLTQINPSDQITSILDRAMMELENPIPLKDGRVTQVRASAGVAFFPEQAQTAAALIDAADQAMYAVKRARKEAFNMDTGAPSNRQPPNPPDQR